MVLSLGWSLLLGGVARLGAAEYIDCQDISVPNELASGDFLTYRGITVGTRRPLAELQGAYHNFLQPPTGTDPGDRLFVPVKSEGELKDGFLTCNFAMGAVFECETSRIAGSDCATKTKVNGSEVEIVDCAKFDNQKAVEGNIIDADSGTKEKTACYPPNHLCNRYREDIFNNYYNVDGLHFGDGVTSTGKFFLYRKNAIPDGPGKNCNLIKFPCDMKLKNEVSASGKNIVLKDSSHADNKKFITNIFAGLGNRAFFKFVGSCQGTSACASILSGYHYYKYVNGTTVGQNTTVYYFKKNIDSSSLGILCNKYLPSCHEIDVGNSFSGVLYNNSDNNNNFKARRDFYSTHKSKVQEENLWFIKNNNSINYSCLAINGTVGGTITKDIGYCSDLNEARNGLKYSSGLNTIGKISDDGNLVNIPNCYLKSCSDLTPEEFSMIATKGTKSNKYCSEYRWLSNLQGLKYFPKENPPHCSDVETVSSKGEQLVFRQAIYEHVKCTSTNPTSSPYNNDGSCASGAQKTSLYYSYGGGLNSERDNCYLKNCYSLSSSERKAIAEARLTNIGFELERSYGLLTAEKTETAYDGSNIPVYCDSGFLFEKDPDGFSDFEHLNLNLIPCFEMSPEQLQALSSVSGTGMILFTDVFRKYDTNSVYGFCRTHYIPLDRVSESHDSSTLFLETMLAIANETGKIGANAAYSAFFGGGKFGNVATYNARGIDDPNFAIPTRAGSDYRKVPFSSGELKSFSEKTSYGNICKFVDNNFLYYNADIKAHNVLLIKDNLKLSKVLKDIEKRNTSYTNCLNNASSNNSKAFNPTDVNTPQGCKDCMTKDDPDACLYGISNCKVYAYSYGCKKEHCSGDSLKYCEEGEKINERIVDCASYKSAINVYDHYFDCGLYSSTNASEKKIFEDFVKTVGTDSGGKETERMATLKTACENALPMTDSRPEVLADTLSKTIKPYPTSALVSTGGGSSSPSKSSLERYGCIKFESPSDNYGLYGCKIPRDDSAYITGSLSPSTAINGVDVGTSENPMTPARAVPVVNVCSRFPKDVKEDGKCGSREGSSYADKCVNVSGSDVDGTTLEDTSGGAWFFAESTGGSRFRLEKRTHRDFLVLRDFHTYHYCYSDWKKEFQDPTSGWIITGEGAILGTAISVVGCPLGCIAAGPFYVLCVTICVPVTIGISIGISMAVRSDEWQINLQNDLQIARGYNSVPGYEEKGFIGKAFVVDNNNYMYRFYPRVEYIEDDLRNKLENNVAADDGKRFYHGNSTGGEIIKKCKIGNLFSDSGNCIQDSAAKNGCDYSYQYNKLKEDGTSDGSCGEKDPINCLHETQKACLEAYGVSFVKNTGIDEDFLTRTGDFLKYFRDGDIVKDSWGKYSWGKSSTDGHRSYVPVDIVYYTKDRQTLTQLKTNPKCEFGVYGDPIGDLSRCRGFEHNGIFYSESQTLKLPLMTSPFLFYTLLTPKNTPELFDPTLIVVGFYHFSDLINERSFSTPNDMILDFFNPKIRYDYKFSGGVSDPDFENLLAKGNDFLSVIESGSNYSAPYILKYKSNNIPTEREYRYVLHKTYKNGLKNEYIPQVCIYKIMVTAREGGDYNTFLDLKPCTGTGCIAGPSNGQGFMVVDNNIECYPRRPLNLNEFILKPDKDMTYRKSLINVFMEPAGKSYGDVTGTAAAAYAFKDGDSSKLEDLGENEVQGFGLNFTRSYCSKIYRDYYIYQDQLVKERASPNRDGAKINRLLKNINTIETAVIPECDQEDGEASDILVSDLSAMKTLKDVSGEVSKVVALQVARIRKYNESYGSYGEVCISDQDIDKIFELRREFSMGNSEMPKVLAFADRYNRKIRTKCILDDTSRRKTECLLASKAYIYCDENRIGCREVLNMSTLSKVFVKTIDCKEYLGKEISESNIEYVAACFKGGFNYSENIYTRDGAREASCVCRIVGGWESFDTDLFTSRPMTPREYGLCVDLDRPMICPAVRYYDSSREYVDDELALAKTEDELKNGPESHYEQHLWRTSEKQIGILPAVFFSMNLGHAEFPASVYCRADDPPFGNDEARNRAYFDDNCVGGLEVVAGECRGFWKQNGENVPQATCSFRTGSDGTVVYEYELTKDVDAQNKSSRNKYECIRYSCPDIGYGDGGSRIEDERDIDTLSSGLFTALEVNDYTNVLITDYRSFRNNEERSLKTVDTRGSSNGFALWREKESSDFTQLVTSERCMTGFAPAGSSYYIGVGTFGDDDLDYDLLGVGANYSNLVALYRQQNGTAENYHTQSFPKRFCDQKGRWLTVLDIYNGGLVSAEQFGENFYYDDENNFWLSVLGNSYPDGPNNDPAKYGSNYCERLVCGALEAVNENIYLDEVLNKMTLVSYGQKSAYTTWRHLGGADWEKTSSPRNTSALMDTTGAFGNSSRNVVNVFDNDNIVDDAIDNKYKYVKKVRGTCRNTYGYYNRSSKFHNADDFVLQLEMLRPAETKGVNPRTATLLSNAADTTGPYRVCGSAGLWGGISDRCFRVCEMINIYNTEIDPALYKDGVNLLEAASYTVENHQILAMDTRGDSALDQDYREGLFTLYGLRDEKLRDSAEMGGFIRGDYLTGGATWPRAIVERDSFREENAATGKKGLRYVEITGGCDSTYGRNDNKPSQYIILSASSRPKRRCYEDGTWGQVYGATRCLLAKNCMPFYFFVEDLADLIEIYNGSKGMSESEAFEKINTFIAELYYTRDEPICEDGEDSRNKYGCKLPRFEAAETSLEDVLKLNGGNDAKLGAFSKNKLKTSSNAYASVSVDLYPTICCLSEKCEGAGGKVYVPGWNIDSRDIGDYFVPLTCRVKAPKATNYSFSEFRSSANLDKAGYLNRLEFMVDDDPSDPSGLHYAKDSLLHFVYNRVNKDPTGGYSEKTHQDGETIDDSGKHLDIGSKHYRSYQLRAKCDDKYFYNENTLALDANGKIDRNTDSKDANVNYYSKDIIFECKSIDDTGAKFGNIPKTKKNTDTSAFIIEASDCLPKTCGSNKYQILWTKSVIKEVGASDKVDYYAYSKDSAIPSSDAYISTLTCKDKTKDGMQTAFVIDYNDGTKLDGTNVAEFYKIDDTSYEGHNFVETFRTECVASTHSDDKINGTVAEKEYDRHIYGSLSYSTLPHTFCKNIDKTDCVTVTEAELINTPMETFKNAYCVKMSCPGNNLKFDGSGSTPKILYDQTEGIIFNMPEKDYAFDTVVVIQSYAGDYSEASRTTRAPAVANANVYSQYGGGKVTICPDGEDIYNATMGNYSLDAFANGSSGAAKTIYECFGLLENGESSVISKASSADCEAGYEDVDGNVCVQYKTSGDDTAKTIRALHDAAEKYLPPDSVKNDAVDFMLAVASPGTDVQDELNILDNSALAHAKARATAAITGAASGNCHYDGEISLYANSESKYDDVIWYTVEGEDEIQGFVKDGSDGTCTKTVTEGEGIDAVTTTIAGKILLQRSVFDTVYGEQYEAKKAELMAALKTAIKNRSKLSNIYDEYYKIFRMKDFLLKDTETSRTTNKNNEEVDVTLYTNLENYNTYLDSLIEMGGFKALYYADSEMKMFQFQNSQAEGSGQIVCGQDFTKSISAMPFCSLETDNGAVSCSLTKCGGIGGLYEKYFLNFLESPSGGHADEKLSTYRPRTHLSSYINNITTLRNSCAALYNNFVSGKQSFEANRAASSFSFNSGFFMAMKCTPEGWQIIDSPSCKPRCSIVSESVDVDPYGVGEWKVSVTAEKIRHNRKYKFTLSSVAAWNCCGKSEASRRSEITVGCVDGNASYSYASDLKPANGWEWKDKDGLCYLGALLGGAVAVLSCLCGTQTCSVQGRIDELNGSGISHVYREDASNNKRIVYACPNNTGGTTQSNGLKDCGDQKLDNTAVVKYNVKDK
jgi:hypothetical protein